MHARPVAQAAYPRTEARHLRDTEAITTLEGLQGFPPDGDEPLLPALPMHHDSASLPIDLFSPQPYDLAGPQTAAQQQVEEGEVARLPARGTEAQQLVLRVRLD